LNSHPIFTVFVDVVTVAFRVALFADDELLALGGGQNLLKFGLKHHLCHDLNQLLILQQRDDIQRLLDLFLAFLAQCQESVVNGAVSALRADVSAKSVPKLFQSR